MVKPDPSTNSVPGPAEGASVVLYLTAFTAFSPTRPLSTLPLDKHATPIRRFTGRQAAWAAPYWRRCPCPLASVKWTACCLHHYKGFSRCQAEAWFEQECGLRNYKRSFVQR